MSSRGCLGDRGDPEGMDCFGLSTKLAMTSKKNTRLAAGWYGKAKETTQKQSL